MRCRRLCVGRGRRRRSRSHRGWRARMTSRATLRSASIGEAAATRSSPPARSSWSAWGRRCPQAGRRVARRSHRTARYAQHARGSASCWADGETLDSSLVRPVGPAAGEAEIKQLVLRRTDYCRSSRFSVRATRPAIAHDLTAPTKRMSVAAAAATLIAGVASAASEARVLDASASLGQSAHWTDTPRGASRPRADIDS